MRRLRPDWEIWRSSAAREKLPFRAKQRKSCTHLISMVSPLCVGLLDEPSIYIFFCAGQFSPGETPKLEPAHVDALCRGVQGMKTAEILEIISVLLRISCFKPLFSQPGAFHLRSTTEMR
jgi:hypothetical protein